MIVRVAQEAGGLVIETIGHDGPPLTLVIPETMTASLRANSPAGAPPPIPSPSRTRRLAQFSSYAGVFAVAAVLGMVISGTRSDANALGHRFRPKALSVPLIAKTPSPAPLSHPFVTPVAPQAAQPGGSSLAATPSSASVMPAGIAKALATRPVILPGTDSVQPQPEASPSAAPPIQHPNPASLFGLQP